VAVEYAVPLIVIWPRISSENKICCKPIQVSALATQILSTSKIRLGKVVEILKHLKPVTKNKMLQTEQMQNHQNRIKNKIKVSPLDYRSKCCPKIINRNNCNNRWMPNNSKCRATKIEKEVQIRKVKSRFKLPMRRFQILLESRWNSCNNLRRVK